MVNSSGVFPSAPELLRALRDVLHAPDRGPARILDRVPLDSDSTYPCEAVTLEGWGASMRLVFCKYEAGVGHEAFGHRGGVEREACAWQALAGTGGVSWPAYHGIHRARDGGSRWLFTEFVDGASRVHELEGGIGLELAGQWLGTFHAHWQSRPPAALPSCMPTYDEDYLRGWAERAFQWAPQPSSIRDLLNEVMIRRERWIEPLLRLPRTVIHGELYPKNVLVRAGLVYVIDWESAAIGPGEIDLASLVEGWPDELAQPCIAAYRRARGNPGGDGPDDGSLVPARVYWHLRWLGSNPQRMFSPRHAWRFDALRVDAGKLGLA